MQSSIVEDPKLALNYHKAAEETGHHEHPGPSNVRGNCLSGSGDHDFCWSILALF